MNFAPRAALAVLAPLWVFPALTYAQAPDARAAEGEANETIVLVRHGEKPAEGLGQLNCQGLNRALALPAVIEKMFGRPAAIFAPDPSVQKTDNGRLYDYVRPLATVEPTAIAFGLPVHSDIGQADIGALQKQLERPVYQNALVLVGWEHREIAKLARAMIEAHGGDPKIVPVWKDSDFDSIYVLKIRWSGSASRINFELKHEGLDGQPATCPGQPSP
jgi:hypothetical protein